MRIGIRAHDLEESTVQGLAEGMKKMGFSCTQLALSKAIREFNTSTTAMTPGLAMYLKDIFAKNQIDIAVLGCYLNLGNPNQEKLEETINIYKAHIRFASLLGCGVVGTETGAVNETYSFEEANHSEEALCIFIKNLKRVVEYAEKMGVIIAIEPVYKHIVNTLERTKRVLDEIHSPNLQVIFDPVNVLSADNYDMHEELVEQAFHLFGEDIAVIHAKDFKAEGQDIISVPCGMGSFQYTKLLSLIKEYKPHIHVLLEDTVPDNAVSTKEFLENAYNDAAGK